MKLAHPTYKSLLCRILPVVFAALFTLCVAPAGAASEPGTVTIVVSAEPHSLDALDITTDRQGQVLQKNIVEALTEIDAQDGTTRPGLATSWKQIDATTWHFFLRKGVKFHDGKDFNADAVVFNVKRVNDKNILSGVKVKFFSAVNVEGRALDPYTVEIKTDKFEPLVPIMMGILHMSSPTTPMSLTRSPNGTGPYKLAKWDAGVQIVLERFDGYWGKKPEIKKAIYIFRGESSVRAAMVLIGEADLAPSITKQDANRPDMDYGYFNSETTNLRIGGIWDPPLNDRRVRMAFNYAIDREALRVAIYGKDVVPAAQLVAPNIFGFNPDLKPWPYDPQKARQLLDEARKDGVPVDREILLVGRRDFWPGDAETMEAAMTMFQAVGFNIKLRTLDRVAADAYRRKPFATAAGPYLVQNSHDNRNGDSSFTVFQNYHCKGLSSSTCDKQLDDLIEKAQMALGDERRALWREAFRRIDKEIVPHVMLYHMVGYCRVGKRINYKPSFATIGEINLSQMSFK